MASLAEYELYILQNTESLLDLHGMLDCKGQIVDLQQPQQSLPPRTVFLFCLFLYFLLL